METAQPTRNRTADALQVVAVQSVLLVSLLVMFLWLVPRFFLQFEAGPLPGPFEVVSDISGFCRRNAFLLILIIPLFMWLDLLLCRKLSTLANTRALGIWSGTTTVIFAIVMLAIIYALATPSVVIHGVREWNRQNRNPNPASQGTLEDLRP
ncbi:MAG: hypothetical protein AAB403_23020 [Planctomycetota bacterium]